MADQTGGSGSTNFLYFIVGALVVAVGIFAYFYFHGRNSSSVNLKVDVPNVSVDTKTR